MESFRLLKLCPALFSGVQSMREELSTQNRRREVIMRDDATAEAVAAANAKLAAEALLRSMSKRLGEAAHEIEVVAISCNADERTLTVLRKGWYQHKTYFFE